MYIDAEEKGLRETLETLIREESWKPMEDAAQTNVLRSASELFAVIKKSLQRCSRFVSRGEPMLRLMGAFQASRLGLKIGLMIICLYALCYGGSEVVSQVSALFHLLQRVLRAYAAKLIARLPKTATGGTTGSASAGTQDWYIKLNDEDVVVVCTIIATAEYCNEVVGALGRNVSKTLDPPFGSQVAHDVAFASLLGCRLHHKRLIHNFMLTLHS